MTNATEDSMTTEITIEMIEKLRIESRGVDGYLLSAICDRALAGEAQAVAECARVIADANAQIDPLYWWVE